MLRDLAKVSLGSCAMIATQGTPNFKLLGTGFICSNMGHFLTCAHLLDLNKPVFIGVPPDANTFPKMLGNTFDFVQAQVVQFDPVNDVAILKIDSSDAVISCPPASLAYGDERDSEIGASVAYLGFPFAINVPKVSQSIISAKVSTEGGTRNLMLDTTVNDKNSGGPLFDLASGKIIGIVAGRFAPGGAHPAAWIGAHALGQDSNISFATGISYAIDLMKFEKIYE
ncbi:S1 family peptidase [Pseudomonas viridiflava]|uniref:S1 family peptidase n=5 Tax=Pseudomonas viridiflava TaxID=33069 RepID=UPI000F010893|nr:serine protease [Pseudomonas viridiflava]MEE4225623.1 serine protease [Pseudomonas viridiflava]QXG36217.1 serine protease [Pseudomonas viridiflava]QXG39361.1 serine protease [Pseudomonas viridiflava]